jgi:hypothetical protein
VTERRSGIPRRLLAEIGELAVAFAWAENAVVSALAKADNANKHGERFSDNLTDLAKLRPEFKDAVTEMRTLLRMRNDIMHGFLFSARFSMRGPTNHFIVNSAKTGGVVNLSVEHLKDVTSRVRHFSRAVFQNTACL